jgi:hypothetical protein
MCPIRARPILVSDPTATSPLKSLSPLTLATVALGLHKPLYEVGSATDTAAAETSGSLLKGSPCWYYQIK